MTRLISTLAILFVASGLDAAEEPSQFGGEWKSSFGIVTLDQKGDVVTGSFGVPKFPIKGKVNGKILTFEYSEGQVKGDAILTMDKSKASYTGTFQIRGGRQGIWNGWRPDPEASQGKTADFAGLWLTDLGLMDLTQTGTKVSGKYALRGDSQIEGEVKGRHLEFRVKSFFSGPGWFDLDEKATALTGAAGTDGQAAWYGLNGRKANEYVRHAKMVAGRIVDGSTENMLTYCIRAPEAWKPDDGKRWPAVLVLHGSNMNATSYVSTIAAAWPDIARDYILLGINGERPSRTDAGDPAFNYSYVNYVGKSTYKGFPGTDRESPALVREAIDELKKVYPIKHYFVGGHSQGGYLTYSILMNSPEAIAGAFPVSCGLIFQCEPSAYDDQALKKAQRNVPLAIVHAKNDPIVPYSMSEYAAGAFGDADWPAFRFFHDDQAAHMFARLPVDKAIRWLEVMNSDDPKVLLGFAEKRLKESGYRDVIAALRRLKGLKPDSGARARASKLSAAVAAKAKPKAKEFLAAIKASKDASWVDGFLAFREEFEFADAASEVMSAYAALRDQQEADGRKAMGEARGLFQQGKRDLAYAKLTEIVEKFYASSSYKLAKQWLAERK